MKRGFLASRANCALIAGGAYTLLWNREGPVRGRAAVELIVDVVGRQRITSKDSAHGIFYESCCQEASEVSRNLIRFLPSTSLVETLPVPMVVALLSSTGFPSVPVWKT